MERDWKMHSAFHEVSQKSFHNSIAHCVYTMVRAIGHGFSQTSRSINVIHSIVCTQSPFRLAVLLVHTERHHQCKEMM